MVNIKFIPNEEFLRLPNLRRTLNKDIPKTNGLVRVVEIEGLGQEEPFDAQACGGLHVRRTGEIGQFKIQKIDNKGRDNRRIKIAII